MLRLAIHSAASIALLATFSLPAAKAQGYAKPRSRSANQPVHWTSTPARYRQVTPVNYANVAPQQFAYPAQARPIHQAASNVRAPQPVAKPAAPHRHHYQPHYPHLNAPLYPCPQYNIPYQVGATVLTNQALAPHEMLYAHEYKAMYPPFYYKVKGGRILTPFGFESHETWKLMGTEVKVKYNNKFSLFSGYRPRQFGF